MEAERQWLNETIRNSQGKTTADPRTAKVVAVLGVLLTASFLYFSALGSYPFLDPDEGRYAEIPREMLESGDYITPRLNYLKYFEKPPLFYWLTAGSMALFGENEWAVRLVPAVAGLTTLLLIMGIGRSLFDDWTGILAGWIYLTSLIPAVLARLPIIDGVFSLLLTATWFSWYQGYQSPKQKARSGWYCISWACLGLAVMTKGIAAIALTGIISGGYILCRRDWRAFRSMAWGPGLFIFLMIVVPWHWAIYSENPGFFHFYIVVQHFARITSQEHAKPFWFFIAVFPFGMLPWTAVFFPAAGYAFKEAWMKLRTPSSNGEGSHILFLLIWVLAVVFLFSLSTCKLVPYILPAYPAMAVIAARFIRRDGLSKTFGRWGTVMLAILLVGLTFVVIPLAARQDTLTPAALLPAVRVAQAGLMTGGILLLISFFKRRMIPFATGFAVVLLFPAMLMIVPSVATHRKIGGFIKAMPQPLPSEIRVAEWRNYDHSLSFYTDRRTILIDEIDELGHGKSLEENEAYFLKGEKSLRRLAEEVPLLVNLRPHDWPKVRKWKTLHPVAANSTNVMVGNDAFFRLTDLKPWSDGDIKPAPLLLMPRRQD